jgi:hypothetical protein
MLSTAKHNRWNYVVTGDDKWFDLETKFKRICLQHRDPRLVPAKQIIHPPKMMITIFWLPYGFHAIEALPPSKTFTSESCS